MAVGRLYRILMPHYTIHGIIENFYRNMKVLLKIWQTKEFCNNIDTMNNRKQSDIKKHSKSSSLWLL